MLCMPQHSQPAFAARHQPPPSASGLWGSASLMQTSACAPRSMSIPQAGYGGMPQQAVHSARPDSLPAGCRGPSRRSGVFTGFDDVSSPVSPSHSSPNSPTGPQSHRHGSWPCENSARAHCDTRRNGTWPFAQMHSSTRVNKQRGSNSSTDSSQPVRPTSPVRPASPVSQKAPAGPTLLVSNSTRSRKSLAAACRESLESEEERHLSESLAFYRTRMEKDARLDMRGKPGPKRQSVSQDMTAATSPARRSVGAPPPKSQLTWLANAGAQKGMPQESPPVSPTVKRFSWLMASPGQQDESLNANEMNRRSAMNNNNNSYDNRPSVNGYPDTSEMCTPPPKETNQLTPKVEDAPTPIIINSLAQKEFAEAKLPRKFFRHLAKTEGMVCSRPRRPSLLELENSGTADIVNIWDSSSESESDQ